MQCREVMGKMAYLHSESTTRDYIGGRKGLLNTRDSVLYSVQQGAIYSVQQGVLYTAQQGVLYTVKQGLLYSVQQGVLFTAQQGVLQGLRTLQCTIGSIPNLTG